MKYTDNYYFWTSMSQYSDRSKLRKVAVVWFHQLGSALDVTTRVTDPIPGHNEILTTQSQHVCNGLIDMCWQVTWISWGFFWRCLRQTQEDFFADTLDQYGLPLRDCLINTTIQNRIDAPRITSPTRAIGKMTAWEVEIDKGKERQDTQVRKGKNKKTQLRAWYNDMTLALNISSVCLESEDSLRNAITNKATWVCTHILA